MPNTTTALQALIAECENANKRALDQIGMGLIDLNSISRARAALSAPPAAQDAPSERAAFEAWLDQNREDKSKFADGSYFASFSRIAWMGWQAHASQPATPAQDAAATVPLQGGLSNEELLAAWQQKLPGVPPGERELSAFAVGVEVGAARYTNVEVALAAALHQPGDTALFAIWEKAAHLSHEFDELVRLKAARPVVSAVLRATLDWLGSPQAQAATPAAHPVAGQGQAGWKLVPTQITEDMHIAAVKTIQRCTGNDDFPRRVYVAMLDAAPTAPQAPALVPLTDAESFVRSLLWDVHPECCGCPVVGAEYMGQQEQVCCGQPEMDTLNDKQIVASLRERFPEHGITPTTKEQQA